MWIKCTIEHRAAGPSCDLAKLGVGGSNPLARSKYNNGLGRNGRGRPAAREAEGKQTDQAAVVGP